MSKAVKGSGKKQETPSPRDDQFVNRELQWLEFNSRVLNEAEDGRTPLLERIRFMSIFTSNLDEFVMKRVGGLQRQVAFGVDKRSLDGMTASQQLSAIRTKLVPMIDRLANLYKLTILPELGKHGVELKKWKHLNSSQKEQLSQYYRKNIFPVLTPLVVDSALPFPFISNLSLSLALKLQEKKEDGEILFGRVKIPEILPQWLLVDGEDGQSIYVSLLQVIAYNLHDLFPDMDVVKMMSFRITRNADLDHDDEPEEDLLESISAEIKQRRFAEPVRLEVGRNSDPWMLDLLKEELEISDDEVYQVPGLLDYTSLNPIADIPLPHLKYEPWDAKTPQEFSENQGSLFDLIRRKDCLVHHPYESFASTTAQFIRAAAEDPKVLAIKMTLYRTDKKSGIISSLIKAAERGKQVVCLVELKARFDEERNIYWAQQMEKVGIHVVYGVIGFKTHCKTALVLRQESKEIQAYAHIGTGNYNSSTAKIYTDFGLFTANEEITQDMVQLFHFLTGRSFNRKFHRLLVAPMNMKEKFIEMIEREIAQKKNGNEGRIVAKFNSLEDKRICELLYQASQEGVQVDLIVRGFCCLRPQVSGLSENIRVYSVIGRFLEHSRIFFFQNGGERPVEGEFYMGSADWMRRNLQGRVEVITPIVDRALKRKIWQSLQAVFDDQRKCWEMQADGTYVQRNGGEGSLSTHRRLMQLTEVQSQLLQE